MAQFIVNRRRQLSARVPYEVHDMSARCERLPYLNDRVNLGEFDNSAAAKQEALKFYPEAEGCYFCCDDCNDAVKDFLRQSKDVRLNWQSVGKTEYH